MQITPNAPSPDLPGNRILVLAPHPDDEVFGCGGAIICQIEKGGHVEVVIFTDGGFAAVDGERSSYVDSRKRESLEAARVLGYGIPTFRGHQDRSLIFNESLVNEVVAIVQESSADLICAPSVMEMHPDHRALGMATVEALRRIDKKLRLAMYEIGVPLQPNLLVDISAVSERKRKAMHCFVSQLEKQRYAEHIAGLNLYRSYTLPMEVTSAEAFLVISSETLRDDLLSVYRPWFSAQRKLGIPTNPSDLPLCSVLIRSTNRKTLDEALDSVSLQTWPNIEVIVVNATGEKHAPIGSSCGLFPIRLIEPGRPTDRASAANQALDAAHGSYLLFLDDDDLILPHHIARLMKEFKSSPSIRAAYAGVICTDQNGETIRRFSEPFDAALLRLQNYLPIHSVLFRRDVLDQGLRFDESLPVCEDWDFWLQILEHWGESAFRFVPETGAIYRMFCEGGSGVWREPDLTRRVMLRIYRKWLARWGDETLWSLFELGRYKKLYQERDRAFAELSSRNLEQQEQLLSLGQEVDSQNRNLQCAETELHGLRKHHASLLEDYSRLQLDRSRLQQDRLGLLDAISSLQKALLERDSRIESLYQSRSWQITRPLRAVTGLLSSRHLPQTSANLSLHKIAIEETTKAKSEPLLVVEPAPSIHETAPMQSFGVGHQTYDYAVDIESESAGAFVYRMVGKNRRVLELGCGPGSITRLLTEQSGCKVTGLEFDVASVEKARPYCEHIYQADLNAADWPAAVGHAEPFDVVVAADVLEHLYDPWRTLRQIRPLIKACGSVILSLPHAGHAALAASFISGNIAYRDWGLLDHTHIRFFGLRNIEALVHQAGLKIVEASYVRRSAEESELAANWLELPDQLRKALHGLPNTNIYQVVIRAVPSDSDEQAIGLGHSAQPKEGSQV